MPSWTARPQPGKGTPSRVAANAAEDVTLTTNERILRDIHGLYVDAADGGRALEEPVMSPAALRPGKEGIMAICSKLGMSCIAPRRKINVMVVGNHSAGKSSYINWYVGEHVQTTAVAIETSGFTFCTSGKKRDTLKGQATLQLFQHLRHELKPFTPGIYDGLMTEVSTSKERCFNLVTFIDTPGLVDGSFHYPFPVEDIIVSMAKHADLIYIFFDPIGQALCDRTMNVIERLNQQHSTRMRYFLSKADTVPSERDRQKVVVQITQNLSSRIKNKHAFELPCLYIPDQTAKPPRIDNAIDRTCDEIASTIHQNVQHSLDKLEEDASAVADTISALLAADAQAAAHNRRAASYGYALFFLSLQPLLLAAAYVLHRIQPPPVLRARELAPQMYAVAIAAGEALVAQVRAGAPPSETGHPAEASSALAPGTGSPELAAAAPAAGPLSLPQFLAGAAAAFLLLQLASRYFRRYQPQYSSREVSSLRATRVYVTGEVLEQKRRLYQLYLEQCSSGVS